jgi:predicted O-linked N-acetylglucosamine transferase (SPINDLY family)
MTASPELELQDETGAIFAHITQGNSEEARRMTEALLAREPSHAVGWYLRGVICQQQGDAPGAVSAFNSAIKYKPDFRKACEDLAILLMKTGQTDLAFQTYMHFVRIRIAQAAALPAPPAAPLSKASESALMDWVMKSKAHLHSGRPEEAAQAARKAHVIAPAHPDVMVNLAMMLNALGRYDEAEELLLKSLGIKPDNGAALNLLGNAYKNRGDFGKAIAAYRLSHKADPKLRDALVNLGKTYFEIVLYTESIEAYERTLKLDPDYLEPLAEITYLRDMLCRWHDDKGERDRMIAIMESGAQAGEPFIALLYASKQLQLNNAMRWTVKLFGTHGQWRKNIPLPSKQRGDGKLRIGYLSSDFHRHATLSLISEMFERHDRAQFEVYAYSHGRDDGRGERQRVKASVDVFRDLRPLDDRRASECIEKDGIDILIDLKGYTQGHRLGLLARRPAPLQMHYLGYPGTTGAPFIDYFLADAIVAPESMDKLFTERLVRLPHSYQINDRSRPLPKEGPSRADYGLPEKGLVFCGFNNPYKITPEMFSLWMRLLAAVEGSVLWLLETHPEVRANLKREAAACGVAPERIVTAEPILLAGHLARYRHADLFLDSAPVCGHTTTSDALWCGVPVVTLAGDSFISRVAASLLHAVGLPQLVTASLGEYEALALSLARDPQALAGLRRHLEEGRMRFPLFDSVRTTRAIEAAYLHAAERHRAGEPPRPFTLAPDFSIA